MRLAAIECLEVAALATLDLKPEALAAAITRLVKKRRLANPRHGFYLVLRPEDQIAGAPDPARWIDPLMRHQGLDYRVSLLRAAAFYGASHQAAMVFQVVAPKQLRDFERVWTELIARIKGDVWKLTDKVLDELREKKYPGLRAPRGPMR